MISGVQGTTSPIWGQLQQQQAQRQADQAEQRANSLLQEARSAQREARNAQSVADRAQENARTLKVESDAARYDADAARRGLATRESLGEMSNSLEARIGRYAQTSPVSAEPVPVPAASPAAPPATFTNAEGQTTGTLINVTV